MYPVDTIIIIIITMSVLTDSKIIKSVLNLKMIITLIFTFISQDIWVYV